MSELNADVIVAAGFKVDQGGKIRTEGGRLVKSEVAAAVAAGGIIANFDPESLRKAKARKAVTGGKSLVALLDEISPNIGLLQPGMTAKLDMPVKKPEDTKDPKRSFVMSIVTKLNNITQEGREWAGRQFDCLSDDEGKYFYVTRLGDTETPHKRKPGGGRPGGGGGSKATLTAALERSKEHLGGTEPNTDDAKVQQTASDAADGKEIVVGGQTGGEVIEEAQVIKQ